MPADLAIQRLQHQLLEWFDAAKRDLPWRLDHDPYRVWVSEIMLQQTRVTAALPYYQRFMARFPTIESLAAAPEADLLAHWAGLGYYYRARNLQRAAQKICASGGFPQTHAEILALSGVGDYTAAAIASICFSLPHAVVDGNVYRVLSRLANDSTNISSNAGKRVFSNFAAKLLNTRRPGDHNQALMELGATVCLPKNPQCLVCPVQTFCEALAAGTQDQLPVKKKGPNTLREERTLFWVERGGHLLLWQRPADSQLMPGFWELPETSQIKGLIGREELGSFRHGITFHAYLFRVVTASPPVEIGAATWVNSKALEGLPLSTVAKKAITLVERVGNQKAAAVS
jgi:A/G-specific adenine glycosylase